MKSRLALVLLIALGMPAWAEDAAPPVQQTQPVVAERPWEKAQAVLDATNAEVEKGGGYDAIRGRLLELEEALAGADAAFAACHSDKDVDYVLTDGVGDTLLSLVAAAAAQEKTGAAGTRKTIAVNNPYPPIALFLGSFYNETGRHEDALRVLDKGLGLYATYGIEFGIHRPALTSERAIALVRLKRLPEALAAYDRGLELLDSDDLAKARMHRGRGFVLIELERLDEAEAAYRESLKLEPDNKIALRELDYIARLKFGGSKVPGSIVTPGAKTE